VIKHISAFVALTRFSKGIVGLGIQLAVSGLNAMMMRLGRSVDVIVYQTAASDERNLASGGSMGIQNRILYGVNRQRSSLKAVVALVA
jgi:hypothetical protein